MTNRTVPAWPRHLSLLIGHLSFVILRSSRRRVFAVKGGLLLGEFGGEDRATVGEFDGTPDVGFVFLRRIDPHTLVDRGRQILHAHRVVLDLRSGLVRR